MFSGVVNYLNELILQLCLYTFETRSFACDGLDIIFLNSAYASDLY